MSICWLVGLVSSLQSSIQAEMTVGVVWGGVRRHAAIMVFVTSFTLTFLMGGQTSDRFSGKEASN